MSDFNHDLAESPAVQCWLCRHAHADDNPIPTCAAFPLGIPAAIRRNRIDHRRPLLDPDTGRPLDLGGGEASITFEPEPGTPQAALDQLNRHLDRIDA